VKPLANNANQNIRLGLLWFLQKGHAQHTTNMEGIQNYNDDADGETTT
jgi:hypothetical protein